MVGLIKPLEVPDVEGALPNEVALRKVGVCVCVCVWVCVECFCSSVTSITSLIAHHSFVVVD